MASGGIGSEPSQRRIRASELDDGTNVAGAAVDTTETGVSDAFTEWRLRPNPGNEGRQYGRDGTGTILDLNASYRRISRPSGCAPQHKDLPWHRRSLPASANAQPMRLWWSVWFNCQVKKRTCRGGAPRWELLWKSMTNVQDCRHPSTYFA